MYLWHYNTLQYACVYLIPFLDMMFTCAESCFTCWRTQACVWCFYCQSYSSCMRMFVLLFSGGWLCNFSDPQHFLGKKIARYPSVIRQITWPPHNNIMCFEDILVVITCTASNYPYKPLYLQWEIKTPDSFDSKSSVFGTHQYMGHSKATRWRCRLA